MKKPTPLYLFVVLISLAITGFAFSIIFIGLGSFGFLLPLLVILIIAGFFLYIAKSLNNAQFEERLKIRKECPSCKLEIDASSEFCPKCGINLNDKVECDYCGHLNPFDTEICQKCNANIK